MFVIEHSLKNIGIFFLTVLLLHIISFTNAINDSVFYSYVTYGDKFGSHVDSS